LGFIEMLQKNNTSAKEKALDAKLGLIPESPYPTNNIGD